MPPAPPQCHRPPSQDWCRRSGSFRSESISAGGPVTVLLGQSQPGRGPSAVALTAVTHAVRRTMNVGLAPAGHRHGRSLAAAGRPPAGRR